MEAELNLFTFLKLSPWAGVEESCGREGLCEDTHFSLCFCPCPVEQAYELQGGEPAEFHQKKKKNTALFIVYQVVGNKEEEGENKVFLCLTNILLVLRRIIYNLLFDT